VIIYANIHHNNYLFSISMPNYIYYNNTIFNCKKYKNKGIIYNTFLKAGVLMIVRLGYVAISLNLPKVTTSSTVTYATYKKLCTEEQKLNKLKSVTLSNLNDLYKILEYNVEKHLHFYRITSALFPLVTHPDVGDWNYRDMFKRDLQHIGEFIKKHNLRVDTHPDEFNVINSTKEEVVKNTLRNLLVHQHLFEDLNYAHGKMVIHLGGAEGGKDAGLKRLVANLLTYPKDITSKLMFENDDKTYTAKETLKICNEMELPMVFDVHHHNCNNNGETIEELLGAIIDTWKNQHLPPKFHFSSPRESEKDRKHSDFVNAPDFVKFIETCKTYNTNIDIMLEAKQKDISLFKLADEIKLLRSDWRLVDNSTFEV
jgi:UV DNA damage endonuclease